MKTRNAKMFFRAGLLLAVAIFGGNLLAQAQTFTTIYTFAGKGADGEYPSGSLAFDSSGALYGTTSGGGSGNNGVVYQLVPPAKQGGAWSENVIYTFLGGADGRSPSGLVFDPNGNLYGTTYYGGSGLYTECGSNGCGTVYAPAEQISEKFRPGGVMKTLKARMFLIVVALLALALTGGNSAQAQTCSVTWTGEAGDGMWSTADNWKPRAVPGPTDDVCIPSGSADARAIPSISVNSLQVSQGAGVVFGSGTASIATPVTMQGGLSLLGTTLSATSVNVESGGSVNGNGTIEGSLTMSGVILPQAAPITVAGNYTQTSTGEIIEYWGSGGILIVDGNATLSGYLYVQYSTRVPPKPGATFTVMTFGSLTGAFTNASPGTAEYHQHSVVEKF